MHVYYGVIHRGVYSCMHSLKGATLNGRRRGRRGEKKLSTYASMRFSGIMS